MTKQPIPIKVLICGILILTNFTASAQTQLQTVQKKIAGLSAVTGFTTASMGIAVKDINSGEIICYNAPNQGLAPASVLKVITTATALEMLGADFCFKTTLTASGTLRNDTLFGDLQVIGEGDPTFGSAYFPENKPFMEDWVSALEQKHIKVITGKLEMDGSAYESQTIPNTWIWEDIGNYYGAGVSAINVFDNQYAVHLSSQKEAGKPTSIKSISPEIPGLEIQNEVLSSNVNKDMAYIYGSPMELKRVIRGTIPKDRNDFVIHGAVPDPAALFVNEFRKALAAKGIVVKGETSYEKIKSEDDKVVVRAVYQSPALRDIIKVTNYESVNLFAEGFLKQLSYQKTGLGSTTEGCKLITDYWKDKGIDMTGFFMCDGSGLSRFNAVTATQMVNILQYMKTQSKWSADFYNSLATAGEGTITSFSSLNFPDQTLRAKSGSMTRVRCLAGYLITKSGRQLSYAILLNNFSCNQAEAVKKIEEVLVELRKL
jgi:D-alanyl-D-alanine carboxypeptidase/D-alanyl-D-alanine-endopeptidase (penicillin-binding protein 4)